MRICGLRTQGGAPAGEAVEGDEEGGSASIAVEEFERLAAAEQFILTVTANGFGKRTSAYEYRVTGRGGQGIANIEMSGRNGHVVASFPIAAEDQIMLVTDGGKLIRMRFTISASPGARRKASSCYGPPRKSMSFPRSASAKSPPMATTPKTRLLAATNRLRVAVMPMGRKTRMSERIGIYPGTFDPITNGHQDIIQRATRLVDRLIIGVAVNAGKGPLFTLEERVALVKAEVAAMKVNNATLVEVEPFDNLLMHFATSHGARVIIRGLRAVSDFEYEFQMAGMNARLNPDVETVFLMASERCQFISSRFVKEIGRLGGNVSSFVSPRVMSWLEKKLEEEKASGE